MKIKRGQCRALRQCRRNSLQASQQRQKFRLHFQDHLCARRRDQLGVAAEMQRVAQALIAVQQDRLSL